MLDELTFGEFITVKRKQIGLSLRDFSRITSLSPSYCSHMEHGKRPAPSGEMQRIIAATLELTEIEQEQMYDLAAKTKKEGTLPFDITEYLCDDVDMYVFLRLLKKAKLKGKNLLELYKR